LSYEEAQPKGDTKTMLAHKLGTFRAMDREIELNAVLEQPIVEVVKELVGIEQNIADQKKVIQRAIDKAKEQLEEEYTQKVKQLRANGGFRGGASEIYMQQD
jgi:hypothetical protein